MSDSDTGCSDFGKVRAALWPVHRQEMKKLVPLLFIFFLISFAYNVFRTMKDTLVMFGDGSGAEVIPFIKVWAMFPGALLLTLLYTRLSNRFSREMVLYIMLSFFLVYFFLFAFYLYPKRDILHPNDFCDRLQVMLPGGFKGLIAMIRNWTFTVFYVMSELWGNIVLFVLFWGFTNQITRLQEAKRFYGLLGFGANFSGIAAGQVSVWFSYNPPQWYQTSTPWEATMLGLITLVLLSGICVLGLLYWMHRNVLNDPVYYEPTDALADSQVKGKLSLRESFSYLLDSRYLVLITLIVVGYNVVINLTEVMWKSQVKAVYTDPSDYNWYINQVSTVIGTVATFVALFVSGNSIRLKGWTFTAMLTPIILLATSLIFFGLFFYSELLPGSVLLLWGLTPTMLLAHVGSFQNILSRAAKYTVFDATKEMAFVPLSAECKLKGKAAIDGVCNRLGKSGGSVIHQWLLILFSSFMASAPYVLFCLLFIIGIWMMAVGALGRRFNELIRPEIARDKIPEPDLS